MVSSGLCNVAGLHDRPDSQQRVYLVGQVPVEDRRRRCQVLHVPEIIIYHFTGTVVASSPDIELLTLVVTSVGTFSFICIVDLWTVQKKIQI